ncbi:MAG: gamma-glutamylcyclotransferase [Gammaproteobacteria bacterium]|nr:gamma-glutamylcyclotransferase [Gammaproteobacteria bacterium]
MLHLSYGSNMFRARIEARLGPCERLGAAYLTRHALRFHKVGGRDGTGKCDAFHTGRPDDRVWGALDRLTDAQITKLDGIEGPGYRREPVRVTLGEQSMDATLYLAKPEARDAGLQPLDWYKNLVLAGARELRLPQGYIGAIEAVPTLPDLRVQ